MKTSAVPALVAILLAAPSCTGITARQKVLLPALQAGWPGIAMDVESGIASGVASGKLSPEAARGLQDASAAMSQAMLDGSPQEIASVPWPALKDAALAGIDADLAAKKIGPDVAPSLRVLVARFDAGISKLLERQ